MTSAYICEMGGCDAPRKKCANCGFESHEAYRRSMIPHAPIDHGVRRILNRYADRLNWLTKEVERLKEIVEKMEPDV